MSRPAPAALPAAAGRSRPTNRRFAVPAIPTVSRHLLTRPSGLRRVLLRWQAPQPWRSRPPVPAWPRRLTPTPDPTRNPTLDPTPATRVPPFTARPARSPWSCPLVGLVGRKNRGRLAPLGGVERPRRVVRFARLIHRRGRDLGGPAVRAACGGNPSRRCWPLSAMLQKARIVPDAAMSAPPCREVAARSWDHSPAFAGVDPSAAFRLG
jgi:hypothetical protein